MKRKKVLLLCIKPGTETNFKKMKIYRAQKDFLDPYYEYRVKGYIIVKIANDYHQEWFGKKWGVFIRLI